MVVLRDSNTERREAVHKLARAGHSAARRMNNTILPSGGSAQPTDGREAMIPDPLHPTVPLPLHPTVPLPLHPTLHPFL